MRPAQSVFAALTILSGVCATPATALPQAPLLAIASECPSGTNYGQTGPYTIPPETPGDAVSGFYAYGNVKAPSGNGNVTDGYDMRPQGGTNTVNARGYEWEWINPLVRAKCQSHYDTTRTPMEYRTLSWQWTGWNDGLARKHPGDDCYITAAPTMNHDVVVGGPSETEAMEAAEVALPIPGCDDPDDDGGGSSGGGSATGGGGELSLYCDVVVDFDYWGHIIGVTILWSTCYAR